MVFQGLQIMGVLLAFIGWLGTIIACIMPMWRVTAEVIWEGLWMNCVIQDMGQMQCRVYDSMLPLPQDLQAARAMLVISVIIGVFGVLMPVVGGNCTICMEDEAAKATACIASGVIHILEAFLIMVPVSWTAHAVLNEPLGYAAQSSELGPAIYIGWGSAALLLLGGGLLCNNCPPQRSTRHFMPAKSTRVRTASPKVDYV
ncbi:claudin-4-like [Pungitius pungitius]|uniref:claudin-4-like n=1 Tax=Pungitius pungitius TaxID=134920 RepID=UPI001888BA61|nr:claudin-4-like [Pungitius pungitius]